MILGRPPVITCGMDDRVRGDAMDEVAGGDDTAVARDDTGFCRVMVLMADASAPAADGVVMVIVCVPDIEAAPVTSPGGVTFTPPREREVGLFPLMTVAMRLWPASFAAETRLIPGLAVLNAVERFDDGMMILVGVVVV